MTTEHDIIKDTLWMARRYAHGRATYATSMVNEAIDKALALGIDIEPDQNFGMYADDGHFGKWNPETKRFLGAKVGKLEDDV